MSTPVESAMKLLAVLIRDKGCANRFFEVGNSGKIFDDPSLVRICNGIAWSSDEGKNLTRDRFEHFLRIVVGESPAAVAGVLGAFDALRDVEVDTEDYEHLLIQVRDQFLQREFRSLIRSLKESSDPSFLGKLGSLSDRLAKLVSSDDGGLFEFFDTKEVYDSFVDKLKERAKNPEQRITCGIREIDDCMTVGFRPGTLTLTVADVGGGKSTMMLNIAFNLFKSGHNVLFLPLEMPFEDIYSKFLSRECMVEFEKIAKPEMLTPDEWLVIEEHSKKVKEVNGGLMWADVKSRPTVTEIKRAIERKMPYFKPSIVVIDYIANIKPDSNEENWLAIGDILKDLRGMGKQHGFAILSAAQMGREGIKKLKNDKDGNKTPGSEDIRGSHEYSADSDNIFAQVPSPDEPNRKMLLYCIKARYGKKVFEGGKNFATLDWFPEFCKVDSGTSGSLDVNDPTIAAMVDNVMSARSSSRGKSKSDDDFSWLGNA
jgi:replicative DNA helicase